ncbi:MAG TPA: tetratricopeptide repeat protein [Planctomycetota bacterium]
MSVPAPLPARRRWLPLGLAGLALAVGLLAWWRGSATSLAAAVPDPVTPEMAAPVRRALASAREAVLAAPDSGSAWGALAEVCDAHHLYPEAEQAYRGAAAREPGEFRWAYGLAVVRDFQGAAAEEVSGLFDAALGLAPRYPPARLRLGDALVRQGRLAEACAAYEQALALDPEFALAHRGLGQTRLALDDVPGALAALERARELDPTDGVTASSLAQALQRAGEPERAGEAAARARELEPVFAVPDPVRFALEARNVTPLACDRRAREHEARGEWSAARPDLERLLEMSVEMQGDDPALRTRLARALVALGEHERAAAELARALELAPDHVAALTEAAGLAQARGDLARAAELYRRATVRAPESALLWKRLGACLGPLGDLPGALAAFERAAGLAPADAELLHNWGTALARAERHAEACERLRGALALEPDSAGAHLSLGASLALLGRRAEALQHYERAAALDPTLPTAEALAELRR